MNDFLQQVQTPLSQKEITFSEFSIAVLPFVWNVEHLEKKWWVSFPHYFRNCWIRKKWLLKGLKGLASEHHSLINVLTSSKHCSNQHGITINLLSREFEVNRVEKNLLYSYLKSWDSLLAYWLPITSIPVAIWRIAGNKFKRHYPKKKKYFLHFLIPFWNVHEI